MGVRTRANEVVIEVWDTGVGVAEQDQVSIFREFHQLGNPERDHRKGLGLGLAIVQGLMQAMGARVSVASRLGRGSVFRLHLPRALGPLDENKQMPEAHLPNLPPTSVAVLEGLKVLVLDDNTTVLAALSVSMQKLGVTYRLAETIEEALQRVEHWRPDVLLTDYRLRGVQTGGDAVRLMREKLGQDLPAIIVTGDTEPGRLREAHRIGAVLLHKPLGLAQLSQALAQVRN